jgi:hypothetical protein
MGALDWFRGLRIGFGSHPYAETTRGQKVRIVHRKPDDYVVVTDGRNQWTEFGGNLSEVSEDDVDPNDPIWYD